jgi:putative ABC transport system substrate-binding protein
VGNDQAVLAHSGLVVGNDPITAKTTRLSPYSTDLSDIFRRVAIQITDVLKGTRPRISQVYELRKFELMVNIKTAKSLGINVSPSIVVSASEVIE